jgi:hypothetical protein
MKSINDDPTAEAIFNFMQEAGNPRKAAVFWNVIPWWRAFCCLKSVGVVWELVYRPEFHVV